MSSPGNALGTSAAGSPNVKWQIDIPGLSQLIVNLGASGLKQLAMAGVDVHSVGCLLLLANLTPTSIEYRRELNRVRELQRQERIWLYKVVEIGAATNFLADQLLKTRAGENVLALLSALLPLLPEQVFTTVLLDCFQSYGVPPESTPGLGQIAKIRAALCPYSSRTDIKDRVVQFHGLFKRLTSNKDLEISMSIPSPDVIPKILSELHKLVTHEAPYILHYHGMSGAAWVAAYACKVLGLGVCAIIATGQVISLSAGHDNARVVLYLGSPRQEFSLWQNGKIEDMISISGPNTIELKDTLWHVSCDNINFLEYHLHNIQQDSQIWDDLSHAVVVEAILILQGLTTSKWEHLDNYIGYHILPIQNRMLRILRILGFNPQPREYYILDDRKLKDTYESFNFDRELILRKYDMMAVAKLAVILAFTNWDTTIRSLSIQLFKSPLYQELHSGQIFNAIKGLNDTHINSIAGIPWVQILRGFIYCTVGDSPLRGEPMWADVCLALELDGIVVLRHTISQQSLPNLEGLMWAVYPGRIIALGEKCQRIRDESSDRPQGYGCESRKHLVKAIPALNKPNNLFPNLSLQYFVSVARDTVWVKAQLSIDESTVGHVSPSMIADNIMAMFISKSCPHLKKLLSDSPQYPFGPNYIHWAEGLALSPGDVDLLLTDDPFVPKSYDFIIQQVDNNRLGQWLACGASALSDKFMLYERILIWQHESCLDCIVRDIFKQTSSKRLVVVIVTDTTSET
jgi:hypothetical protein